MKIVRDFLRTAIADANLGYKEWADAINNENIPSNILDKRFHILVSNASLPPQNNINNRFSLSCEIALFRKGFVKPQEIYDQAYDEAICLSQFISNPANWNQENSIKQVTVQAITPSAIDESNDNTFRFVISCNVLLFYYSLINQ